MLVIKCKAVLSNNEYQRIYQDFLNQATQGLILLSPSFELLADAPADEQIKVVDKLEMKDCKHCGYKMHSDEVSRLPDCNDCAKQRECEYCPRIGEQVRINCPLHEPIK